MTSKTCEHCAFRSANGAKCNLTNVDITEKDFCSKFQKSPEKCDICGRFLASAPFISNNHIFCGDCFKILRTCQACAHSTICDFESNPSPLPKVVEMTQRGPNGMVFATTVKNVEREKITCQKNCKCYNKEYNCIKATGHVCGHLKSIF